MKKLFFDCGTRESGPSAGLFLLRAGLGVMMAVGHALPKIQNFAAMKDHWPVAHVWPLNHMSEPVSLIATIAVELVASLLLVVGFMTRPAAFLLGFVMVIAAFQVCGALPWFLAQDAPMAKEPALLYLLPACMLVLTGAGGWSIDSGLYRERRRRY